MGFLALSPDQHVRGGGGGGGGGGPGVHWQGLH